MEKKEAIKAGYLQEKKVFLKPIINKSGKMVSDRTHSGYFMWEGAVASFTFRIVDDRGNIINPFKNDDERKYFESVLGQNLNPYDVESKWYTQKGKFIKVDVQKTPDFMSRGMEFRLDDPEQNLQYRVLVSNKNTYPIGIAPSPDEVKEGINYKFVLVEENYEDDKSSKTMDMMSENYIYYGTIKDNVKKLRDLLGIYITDKKISKQIPKDVTKEWLVTELNKAFKDDYVKMYQLITDPEFENKIFIDKCIRVGAIAKQGINSFSIVDEGDVRYSYKEILERIVTLKESQDNTYIKMTQLIKNAKI